MEDKIDELMFELYDLEEEEIKDRNEFVYGIDNEIKEAFKILLSKNEETKGKVENLISRILEVAGKNESARTFWPLVEVVRNRRR